MTTMKTPNEWDKLDPQITIRRWHAGFNGAENQRMSLFEFLARREKCAQSPRRKERKNDNDRSIGAAGSIGSSNNLRRCIVVLARRVVAFVTGTSAMAARPSVSGNGVVLDGAPPHVDHSRDSDAAI